MKVIASVEKYENAGMKFSTVYYDESYIASVEKPLELRRLPQILLVLVRRTIN